MRATFIVALLAAVASAATIAEPRDIHDYPDCAVPCFREVDHGRCQPRDLDCLCNSSRWMSDTARCFQRRCNDRDEHRALWAQKQTCDRYNHGGHGGDHGGDHDHDHDGHH